MKEKRNQKNVGVDPIGQKMYNEVLHKDIFDKKHPPPLIGVREFTINHLFAKVWSRSVEEIDEEKTISLRERRLITIALLAAQGRSDQLIEHVTGASHAGIEEKVLIEVMIHVAHYSGWPAGSGGQKIVQDIYKKQTNRKDKKNSIR